MDHKLPLQDYQNVPRNVRGKKTKDPGYQPGNNWIVCDRCGSVIRSQDAKKEWTGLWVCPDDWEIRHPQDFVRGRVDEIAADINRPEGPDQFVDISRCTTNSAVVGEAVVGCAIVGFAENTLDTEIPSGTFNNSL